MRSRDLASGALVGYLASRTMDGATSWFFARQTQASKRREEELAPGGALTQVGKQLGRAVGRELSDEAAGRTGLAVHRALGVTYGIAAMRLVNGGVRPLAAGALIGAAAFALIDEGTAIAEFREYPVESHLRGVVGHATYGLAAGAMLEITTP